MGRPSVATIRDVARAAAVSTATVSHVFNNTRTVSATTRQAVLAAAAALNYRPSAVARSLSTRRTRLVGVVIADVLNPYFATLIRGIEERLWSRGYGLLVCSTDEQPDKEAHYLRLLLEQRADGVILAPTGAPQPILDDFHRHHIPLVFVDRRPPLMDGTSAPGSSVAYGPTVEVDNFAAGYAACAHLLGLGHRRIAILTRVPTLSTVLKRTEGYRQALVDAGVAPEAGLVAICPTAVAARQAVADLLARADPPTALIATNYALTLATLEALQTAGVRCPQEISLVAFDDPAWAALTEPPLTAIRHPLDGLTAGCVESLLLLLANQEETPTAPDIVLPTALVERKSCRQVDTTNFAIA